MCAHVAVVAGSTGLVGGYLSQVLAEDAYYDTVQLLTRADGLDTLCAEQMPEATHLFCCLGTTIKNAGSQAAFRKVDYEYVLNFARAGFEAGARTMMVVSSVGADAKSRTFYLRVKGEMEDELERVGFTGLHIFQPSVLMGKRAESRPGEEIGGRVARSFEWLMLGGLSKYKPMPAGVLAAAMAAAGERGAPGTHRYRYDEIYKIAGV